MVGWGPIGKKDPRLQAQKPLLDGGEAKSLDKTIVNNIADVTSGFPKDTDVGLGQISEQTGDSTGRADKCPQTTGDPPCESKIEFAGLMPQHWIALEGM